MQGPVHIVHTTLLTIYNTVYWRYETEWFDRKFPPPMSDLQPSTLLREPSDSLHDQHILQQWAKCWCLFCSTPVFYKNKQAARSILGECSLV